MSTIIEDWGAEPFLTLDPETLVEVLHRYNHQVGILPRAWLLAGTVWSMSVALRCMELNAPVWGWYFAAQTHSFEADFETLHRLMTWYEQVRT